MDRLEGSPGRVVRALAMMEAACLVRQLMLFVPKLGETHDAVMGHGKRSDADFSHVHYLPRPLQGNPCSEIRW